MRLAIVGLGLIGGSIARAVRSSGTSTTFESISAWSPSGTGPAAARADGVIDRVAPSLESAVADVDLVVLAADPLACLDLIDAIAAIVRPADQPTITDVASTKQAIVDRAEQRKLAFVGGHPMAGREVSGYGAARADLFLGRPWVVCPGSHARPVDVERVEALVGACGAIPRRLSAREHDRAVAGISHLPLALAVALAQAVGDADDWPIAAALAAGAWASATRVAKGDVTMGAGLAATNAPELARRIRAIVTQLEDWLADLEETPDDPAGTATRIALRLAAARELLGPVD